MKISCSSNIATWIPKDIIELIKQMISDNIEKEDFIMFFRIKLDKKRTQIKEIVQTHKDMKEKHTIILNKTLDKPLSIESIVVIKNKRNITIFTEKEFLTEMLDSL